MPQAGAVRRGIQDAVTAEIIDPKPQDIATQPAQMPADVASDPVMSEIWAWICPPVNAYTMADVPLIRELVTWHATYMQAAAEMTDPDGGMRPISDAGSIETADGQTIPLLRKHPAVDVMKAASAEIRALSNELALSPMARSRLGLNESSTLKNLSAVDTAKLFRAPDAKYRLTGGGK
jgi:P27 family predicted phage terminase small subunit